MNTIVCHCFSITKLSFLDPTTLAVGVYERIILLPTSIAFTFTSYCTDKSTAAERTHVAIKNGKTILSNKLRFH